MKNKLFIVTLSLCLFFVSEKTYAADNQIKALSDILADNALEEGQFRYAPNQCDFEMIFPEQPFAAKRCEPGSNKCTNLTSYTMVYDVTTTVEVSVTCVPSSPAKYKDYSERVISLALNGMVERADITEQEINTTEEEKYRRGSLLGSSKRGKQNSIYNAQIWVGQNSIMTTEAKLIGPYHEKADIVFSKILASIKSKEAPEDTSKKDDTKNSKPERAQP